MGTHYISALEEYCHDQAGIHDEQSSRWLFINFLDELLLGFLAHKTLTGTVESLDEILYHDFWVFGVLEDTVYYGAFSCFDKEVVPERRDWMKDRIQEFLTSDMRVENAANLVSNFNCTTITAISFGHNEKGEQIQILYWHPIFTPNVAQAILKETVCHDDDQ